MPLLPPPSQSLDAQVTALRERAGAREVDDRVLRVSGADRADWLAGMVTNDTKGLRPGQSRYTAVVHVKGKLLADAWVHARDNDVLLVVHPSTVEPLLAHFEQYIVMEDVEVVAAPELRVVSVQGPTARALLGEGSGSGSGAVFESDRLGRGGLDWVVASDADADAAAVRAALARADVPVVSDAAWDVARLEAGVPRFGVDFTVENYVQEANIAPRAVSTNKGCYVGQEVVYRLEVRGHVRRQLTALTLAGEPPAAGAVVQREGADVGAVTSAVWSPALQRSVALAMVKWDVATAGGALDVAGRPASIVARPVP